MKLTKRDIQYIMNEARNIVAEKRGMMNEGVLTTLAAYFLIRHLANKMTPENKAKFEQKITSIKDRLQQMPKGQQKATVKNIAKAYLVINPMTRPYTLGAMAAERTAGLVKEGQSGATSGSTSASTNDSTAGKNVLTPLTDAKAKADMDTANNVAKMMGLKKKQPKQSSGYSPKFHPTQKEE